MSRQLQAYQRVALESAPPSQILEQLYDRLLLDLSEVKAMIQQRDIIRRSKAADHAIRILEALRVCLDYSVAPELCARLDGLYEYVLSQLSQASFSQSVTPIIEAEKRITQLQETFRQAASAR